MSGIHGRFSKGLTSQDIASLRGQSTIEEQFGVGERIKQIVDRLSSTTAGSNLASLLKIADAGNNFTADTLEGVLAELAAAGTTWKKGATVFKLMGQKTVAALDALGTGAAVGDAYIAGDAGTPAQGTSDLLAVGDIAEWDGTQWKTILANSGGFVPAGTVCIVGSGTLVAPLTNVTDRNKVATFDGASNTPSLAVPTKGEARFIVGQGSKLENRAYVYDTSPAGWVGPHGNLSADTSTFHTAQSIAYARSDASKNKIPDAADDVEAALTGLDNAMPIDGLSAFADGADRITNTASQTAFANTVATAANEYRAGDEIVLEFLVSVPSGNNTDTLALALYMDAQQTIGVDAWDVSNGGGDIAVLRLTMRVLSAGASGVLYGYGKTTRQVSGGASAVKEGAFFTAAFDTTTTHTFSVKATWSGANAANQADLKAVFKTRRAAVAVA